MSVRDLARLAPFFLVGLAIVAGDLAFYVSREPLDLGYLPIDRVLIAAHALWFYVGKLLWPADLAIIYPFWEVRATDPIGWLYVAAAVAVVGGAVEVPASARPGSAGRGSCSSRSRCRRFWGSWTTATCSSPSWPTASSTWRVSA